MEGGIREWANGPAGKWVVGVACLLAIGTAVTLVIRGGWGANSAAERIRKLDQKYDYYCPNCKTGGEVSLAHDVIFTSSAPTECPNCRKKTAVPGFLCENPRCRKISRSAEGAVYYCEHCGQKYRRMMVNRR